MRFLRQLLPALLLLFTALNAWAAGPVWKVSKGQNVLYLGGTIHLLSRADYPLPPVFDRAYGRAAELVLETDLDRINSPEFQKLIAQQMLLPGERTLRDVLKPATLRKVEAFVAARGLPFDKLQRFKPSMLDLVLTVGEFRRLGLTAPGVDQFYLQRARTDHKHLGKLESAEVQLALMTGLGEGHEDAMVDYSLGELKRLPKMIETLKTAWRKGDIDAMAEVALAPWQQDFPQIYREMLVRRNRNWLPRIEALLQSPQVELVLVGALHLAGPDGLLRQLAAHGYRVEQL